MSRAGLILILADSHHVFDHIQHLNNVTLHVVNDISRWASTIHKQPPPPNEKYQQYCSAEHNNIVV